MNAKIHWILSSIRQSGWAPLGLFLIHVIISRLLNAYLVAPWLDIPMHFLGGVAITYFFRESIISQSGREVLGVLSTFAVFLFSLAAVSTSTVLWEFAEWTTDHMELTESQLGLEDTLLDMFLGIAGGSIFLLIAGHSERDAPEQG